MHLARSLFKLSLVQEALAEDTADESRNQAHEIYRTVKGEGASPILTEELLDKEVPYI